MPRLFYPGSPWPPAVAWEPHEPVRLTTPALEEQRRHEEAIRCAVADAVADAKAAAASSPGGLPADSAASAEDLPAPAGHPPAPEPVMTPANRPATPPAPSPASQAPGPMIDPGANAAERARGRAALRRICDLLGLAYLCRHATCGRRQRCQGDPEACIPALTRQVPAPVRAYVRHLLEAQENGWDDEETWEALGDQAEIQSAWLAGLRAAARPRAPADFSTSDQGFSENPGRKRSAERQGRG